MTSNDHGEVNAQESITSENWHLYFLVIPIFFLNTHIYTHIYSFITNTQKVFLSQKKKKRTRGKKRNQNAYLGLLLAKKIRTPVLTRPIPGSVILKCVFLFLFLCWKKDQGSKGNKLHKYSQWLWESNAKDGGKYTFFSMHFKRYSNFKITTFKIELFFFYISEIGLIHRVAWKYIPALVLTRI